jgi:DNA-binding NarL/FixJ family response regulator
MCVAVSGGDIQPLLADRLNRQDRASAVSNRAAPATNMGCMPPPRVLIVDDQPVFRQVARDLLRVRGCSVVAEADCLRTALDALERCAPDAVLLDVRLGAESGFDVARALTRARPGLAVLLVSADEGHACPERVRECGARGFVPKPRLVDADFGALWR